MTEGFNVSVSPAFRDGVQYAWSATTIKWAETCLRYYQYSMIEGWHGKGVNANLKFGGHYATAIEHFYKNLAEGMDREQALRAVVREALENTWERGGCDTCGGDGLIDEALGGEPVHGKVPCPDCDGTGNAKDGRPWLSDDNLKNRDNLIRSIVWYFEQFRDDAAKPVILEGGKPAVELSFSLPVDNDILFVGHLDRLAEYADNLYIQDQKTTKQTISNRYFEGYNPETQMSMYTFAGNAVFGIPVKGVMIDAAQVAVGFTRFERGFTFRTQDQLNEWYDSAMYTIERAQHATRENHFPMNPSSCGNYGGCTFRTVCSRSPAARKNFLLADFVQGGGYDPLERR